MARDTAPIVKQRTSYEYKKNSTISIDIVNNLGLYLETEIMLDNDSLSNFLFHNLL